LPCRATLDVWLAYHQSPSTTAVVATVNVTIVVSSGDDAYCGYSRYKAYNIKISPSSSAEADVNGKNRL